MLLTLTKPSSLIHDIRSEKIAGVLLFKFSDSLQHRIEELLEKMKQDKLTLEESSELEAIEELDRTFMYINAMSAPKPPIT
jgi:arginine decarboxylase-like protein